MVKDKTIEPWVCQCGTHNPEYKLLCKQCGRRREEEKNWKGTHGKTFAIIGASNHAKHEREKDDYYATEPRVIQELFSVEEFSNNIWEPACGEKHLSSEMEWLGKKVLSSDKVARVHGVVAYDFLSEKTWHFNGDIITNPPYKYAMEFIEKAYKQINHGRKIAMFLKITFLEGVKRHHFFKAYPPKTVHVYSSRRKCALNGDFDNTGGSPTCYAWYVWEKGYQGETTLKWLK